MSIKSDFVSYRPVSFLREIFLSHRIKLEKMKMDDRWKITHKVSHADISNLTFYLVVEY